MQLFCLLCCAHGFQAAATAASIPLLFTGGPALWFILTIDTLPFKYARANDASKPRSGKIQDTGDPSQSERRETLYCISISRYLDT